MSIIINLSLADEARLFSAASQSGLAPEELIQKALNEYLPSVAHTVSDLDAKLRQWQEQDNTKLMPTRTAAELFAQWDVEAARMTDEEREAEDRIWDDFQNGINDTRAALDMRQL